MVFETENLILRPWHLNDAEFLYEFAKDPLVGPAAGWPSHKSVIESKAVIKTIFSMLETYAIIPKGFNNPAGCVALLFTNNSNLNLKQNEAEIGYWLGRPFWGKGLATEAVKTIIAHSFRNLKIEKLWCGYFDGNEKSRRVQQKCGFIYQYTKNNTYRPPMNDIRTEHISCLTKKQWENLN